VTAEALVVRGLTRRYGRREAVSALDLTVHEGDVYGFLGPNGAGKTTALRCILDLIRRDAGEIRIFGDVGRAARRHVGAIVETPAFHNWLSGRENLRLACLYAGLSGDTADREVERTLERVGLSARAKDPVGGYSLGMRQRLALARTLLGKPRLLLLDEPTNGLDPTGMREVRDLVRSLALTDRITVLLSSHLLAEVQQVCNRVGILSEGRLKAEGAVSDLLAADVSVRRTVEIGADPGALRAAVATMPEVTVEGPGGEGRLRVRLAGIEVPELVRRLVAAGVAIESVLPDRRNLEDVFVEVTSGKPSS